MDERIQDGASCWGEERENKGGNSQEFRWKCGHATEPLFMSACSRHQVGGAIGEQDQSKCPHSGMSPQAVSFNNPSLVCRVGVPDIDARQA